MKKNKWVGIFACMCCFFNFYAEEQVEPYIRTQLVQRIYEATAPVISDDCVVFTAKGSSRYTGIAFEHEDYKIIHQFKRLTKVDEIDTVFEPVLFHIIKIPKDVHQLRYRIVVDGLWTTDPLNEKEIYDFGLGMSISVLDVPYTQEYKTITTSDGYTRFVYQGERGLHIRLAGSFNNWDPFMYTLTEVKPGFYELNLPLPRGTWFYAFFKEGKQLVDRTNSNHVYTADGRTASVLTIN